MTAPRPPISVYIERLVLDGLPLTAAQAVRMQRALERELASLISQGGDLTAWTGGGAAHSTAPVAGRAVPWDATRPHQLGRALAHTVFASLSGAPPRVSDPGGRS
ncbi:MAG TPA: hypothetical protein VN253_11830 [Kofleriaceae bacterium]|nr:hypothetical protein [Kofleriaceae bacterium]